MGSLYFITKLILTLSLQVSSMQRQLTKVVSFSKSHDSFMIQSTNNDKEHGTVSKIKEKIQSGWSKGCVWFGSNEERMWLKKSD